MARTLINQQNRDLCMALFGATSQNEAVHLLRATGFWEDPTAWRYLGDDENNHAIVGAQASSPEAALVEKLVNSVDAVLVDKCLRLGINPEGPEAPVTITQATERFFGIKQGNLANLSATERSELAKKVGLIASGTKTSPNYIVFDTGEGQTPNKMPNTLLSIRGSNKLRIPFVQGRYNMGGSGASLYCGSPYHLQLVLSRRDPQIVDTSDPSHFDWGFTVVRREKPSGGRRNSLWTYLAPEGKLLSFPGEKIDLTFLADSERPSISLGWGTIVKLFEYQIGGSLKTVIKLDLYNRLSLLLPRLALPIRLYEWRAYPGHTPEETLAGLGVRLEEDKRDNLEPGYPTSTVLNVAGQTLKISIYAFREGQAKKYRKDEGVIFTFNGQTHGYLSKDFFRRHTVGMDSLRDSILVIVECDGLSDGPREDLFATSRDRLREGVLRLEIEKNLESIIRSHSGLRELRETRRKQDIEKRLKDSRPLQEALEDILSKHPALAQFLSRGFALGNPFKTIGAAETEEFKGKLHPTFFRLAKGEEEKNCHINLRFRVQFETDVVNDYFVRDRDPGRFSLRISGDEIRGEEFVLNLWNGTATLTVALPKGVLVGDVLSGEAEVTDDTLIEAFILQFRRTVMGPMKIYKGKKGKRRKPGGRGSGDRQVPSGLSLPLPIPVKEADWPQHEFDKYSALRVVHMGDDNYHFYVNVDNVFLKAEMKTAPTSLDPLILEERFKIALALIGLAMLNRGTKDNGSGSAGEEEDASKLDNIAEASRALAPVLLPMIDALGSLEIRNGEESLDFVGEEPVESITNVTAA